MRPMGPIGPRGFPGRDGSSTIGGTLTSTGLGIPPMFNANLSTIGIEKFSALFGRITESCDAISTKCESKLGRTPKYDREKSVAPGSGFGAISGKHMTKGI